MWFSRWKRYIIKSNLILIDDINLTFIMLSRPRCRIWILICGSHIDVRNCRITLAIEYDRRWWWWNMRTHYFSNIIKFFGDKYLILIFVWILFQFFFWFNVYLNFIWNHCYIFLGQLLFLQVLYHSRILEK